MGDQIVDIVIEGGKASAAPPLGPALGPMGVNIQEVVDSINEKTRELAGVKVPVKVIINPATKKFRLEIGTPPASALILKELGLQKGSGTSGTGRIGNLTIIQAKKISKAKFGTDDAEHVNQIKGTCRSMGITVGEGEVSEEELKAAEDAQKAAIALEESKDEEKDAAAEGESEEKPEEKKEE
ncbi:MAG: 50S ribosomal protein L11 [Candidatus Aenigmarchaeota archaeon]|nr:50S ribosomal protein L11 [Candidatus Aenigmarchaeota archaeon]